MIAVSTAVILAALVLPHLLELEHARPVVGVGIWLSALALRALAALFGALYLVFFLPATELFALLTHWCWHSVLPLLDAHLPVDGHAVGGVAIVVPVVMLAVSVASVAVGGWRAARAVRRLLGRSVIGPGPGESVLLADSDVFMAAAGLRRPQVVVSAGALCVLDDEELAASLAHEHGHIRRRHRWALCAAELLRGFARFVPGTREACRELVFHLERDADAYAIREHRPAALASAICKTAATPAPALAGALGLGGGCTVRRVRQLLEADRLPTRHGYRSRWSATLAGVLAALVLGATAALPAVAHAGLHEGPRMTLPHHCTA